MIYITRTDLQKTGYKAGCLCEHIFFIENEDELHRIFSRQINTWQYDLGRDVKEWLNSTAGVHGWTSAQCEFPLSTFALFNGFVAFDDQNHAMRFKLTW